MIREHYDAVKALLPPTVRVYMWSVPSTPTYPYVCIWGDLGEESSGGPDGDSLCDVPDVLTLRIRATYAGVNGESMGNTGCCWLGAVKAEAVTAYGCSNGF